MPPTLFLLFSLSKLYQSYTQGKEILQGLFYVMTTQTSPSRPPLNEACKYVPEEKPKQAIQTLKFSIMMLQGEILCDGEEQTPRPLRETGA